VALAEATGVAGIEDRIETAAVSCPSGGEVVAVSTTLLYSMPDSDAVVLATEEDDGTFRGTARDFGLPDGTKYGIKLRLTCKN
jgi:hypothetical protein